MLIHERNVHEYKRRCVSRTLLGILHTLCMLIVLNWELGTLGSFFPGGFGCWVCLLGSRDFFLFFFNIINLKNNVGCDRTNIESRLGDRKGTKALRDM